MSDLHMFVIKVNRTDNCTYGYADVCTSVASSKEELELRILEEIEQLESWNEQAPRPTRDPKKWDDYAQKLKEWSSRRPPCTPLADYVESDEYVVYELHEWAAASLVGGFAPQETGA